MTTYRAVIDGSGGDDVIFEAATDESAKEVARLWCQDGSWGPDPDVVRVHIGRRGCTPDMMIEVAVGG